MSLTRILVTSDWHVPGHCRPWVDAVLDCIIPAMRPEVVVLGGDILTCDGESRYLTPPSTPTLADEIAVVRPLLVRLRRAAPHARVVYLQGNHEFRHDRKLWEVRALSGLPALGWPSLLGLDALDIEWVPYDRGVAIGPLDVEHGRTARKWAGYTVSVELRERSRHLVVGHTHRLAVSPVDRKRAGILVGAEAGCGCLWDVQSYALRPPDWQIGCVLATVDTSDRWCSVEPVWWTGDRALLRGDLVRGHGCTDSPPPGVPVTPPAPQLTGSPASDPTGTPEQPPTERNARRDVRQAPALPHHEAPGVLAGRVAEYLGTGPATVRDLAWVTGRTRGHVCRVLRGLKALGLARMLKRPAWGRRLCDGGGDCSARWEAVG